MPRKSTIDLLPQDLKKELNKLLQNGSATIDEIVGFLNEHEFEISRSAVGRYKKNLDSTMEKLKQSRHISEAMVRELGDETESNMSATLRELLRAFILELTTAEGAKVDDMKIGRLAKAIKDLDQAASTDASRMSKIRKEVQEEFARKAAEAAESVENVIKEEGGISIEEHNKIMHRFLGVTQ